MCVLFITIHFVLYVSYCVCMARSDSNATSFSDEGSFSVPKRLFPIEITTMLFTSEPESNFAPETIEDASLFQL